MFHSFANKKFENSQCGNLDATSSDQPFHHVDNIDRKLLIISGPTGVGKTDFAEYLVRQLKYEAVLINGDMGQLYTPISIGTAKPDNTDGCYMFNIMNEPLDLGAFAFRAMILSIVNECWAAGKLPIIVGGSGFYMKSLFYPPSSLDLNPNLSPINDAEIMRSFGCIPTQDLYFELKGIDPERAQFIHQNDRYRIERALFLWKKTLQKPSELKPVFEPLGSCFFYFLTRDKEELKRRINERVGIMLAAGWINEVSNLTGSWKQFLLRKKLIGYPEIIKYLERGNGNQADLKKEIEFKTAQYAKRQVTFWKSLHKQLEESDPNKHFLKDIQEFNLTNNFDCLKDIIVKKLNES